MLFRTILSRIYRLWAVASRSGKKLVSVRRKAEYIFFIPNQNIGIGLSIKPHTMGRYSPPKSGPTGKNGYFRQFFKIELPTAPDLLELHTSNLRWCFGLIKINIIADFHSSYWYSLSITLKKTFDLLDKKLEFVHYNQMWNYFKLAWNTCCQTAHWIIKKLQFIFGVVFPVIYQSHCDIYGR